MARCDEQGPRCLDRSLRMVRPCQSGNKDADAVAGGSARLVVGGNRSEDGGPRTAEVWTGTYRAP